MTTSKKNLRYFCAHLNPKKCIFIPNLHSVCSMPVWTIRNHSSCNPTALSEYSRQFADFWDYLKNFYYLQLLLLHCIQQPTTRDTWNETLQKKNLRSSDSRFSDVFHFRRRKWWFQRCQMKTTDIAKRCLDCFVRWGKKRDIYVESIFSR